MILRFININKRSFTILVFILACVFFSCEVFSNQMNKFYLPDGTGYISWTCVDNLCDTYLKKNKKNILLTKESYRPSVERLSENLIKIFYSCGSPCNYTIFYDSQLGVSSAFEFVVAVDAAEKIVVVAKKKRLVAYKIFNNEKKSLFSVNRNWSPTAALFSAIIEAKYSNHILRIKYLNGKNFTEKDEKIHF